MEKQAKFCPNWASKPSNTIRDILSERTMSVELFAEEMNLSVERTQKLIDGDIAINRKIAFQLSQVLGSSERFWLVRQKQYQESLARIQAAV